MSGVISKAFVYSIVGGVVLGFYLAHFLLSVPLQSSPKALVWPGYVVGVLAVAMLFRHVLSRVQRANVRRFNTAVLQRARLEQLLERLITAQEDERRRLSLELHDSPVQWLTSGVYRVETAVGLYERGRHQEALKELETVREVLDTSLAELRHTASALHPPELEKVGLVNALSRRVDAFARDTGIVCDFEDRGPVPRLGQASELAVYRVVQEALSNVRKHSRANRVQVTVGPHGGVLRAVVKDDGVGFRPDEGERAADGHLGLIGMKERARMVGGSLSVDSAPGAGTTVTLTMPMPAHRVADDDGRTPLASAVPAEVDA